MVETGVYKGDIPTMTVTADAKKRVVLPSAKPGDSYQVEQTGGEIRLRLLKPVPKEKARLVKGANGYLVAVGTRPITQEMVSAAMDEFP
jgi:hypothetical protein